MIAIISMTKRMSRKMVWHWDIAFGRRIVSNGLCMIFTSKRTVHLRKRSQIKVCVRSNTPTKIVIGGYASRRQSDDAFIINTRQDPHEWLL
jgi:hypothetical protein